MENQSKKPAWRDLIQGLAILFAILIIILLVMLYVFGSTPPWEYNLYGIWESAEMGFVFDVHPESYYRYAFPGTYVEDGEKVDATIVFVVADSNLAIFRESDRSVFMERGDGAVEVIVYAGSYRLRRNRLRVTTHPHWRERTGVEEIVFERIHKYER